MESQFFKSYSKHLAYEVQDIADCDREPIQLIGAIQNGGFLLCCSRVDLKIIAVSRNFGGPELFGAPLSKVLNLESGPDLSPENIPALEKMLAVPSNRGLASFSTMGDLLLIEVEQGLEPEDPTKPEAPAIRQLLRDLDHAASMGEEYDAAARCIRTLSGFNRVLIYYFRENWDGQVLAEAADPELDPYLHLRYPATDIPPQARALYLHHPWRMIMDTEADPVAIVSQADLPLQELDLSSIQLRAVSPFHMKYLQNMGVRASFSVPLKVHGRLWGLISCHDTQRPRHLPLVLRTAAELVGRILSGRIANHMEQQRQENRQLTLRFTQQLVGHMGDETKALNAFRAHEPALLKLMDASGAYVRLQGQSQCFGDCPGPEVVDQIIQHIQKTTSLGVWKSESLKAELNWPETPRGAAGAMAIPLAFAFEELIIWFRRENRHVVRWGGKPELKKGSTTRLEPRASFDEWVEQVADRCQPWTTEQDETAQHFHFNFIKGLSSRMTALAHANRELEKIARAKDDFVGMVSHELRTPLSIIIGWIDILRDSVDENVPEVAEAIEVIDRNAKLQISLINDLLDISRIIAGKLNLDITPHVNINQLVKEVVTGLQPNADKKSIRLDAIFDAEIHSHVDCDRFRQAVNNLVVNALKFTPDGGQVHVRLEARGGEAVLIVEDNGIGMEPQQLEHIFHRFTQINSGGKSGLGLGLSIVKSLIELHGGSVQALSAGPGLGSQFVMNFRRAEEGTDPVAIVLRQDQSQSLRGKRVLLAEDDADATRALRFLLQKLGADCVSCSHGLAAYSELMSGEFDLIISDVGMPRMNGYELLRNWRSNEKAQSLAPIPAIALTAFAGHDAREKALSAGFQTHLAKPVARDALLAAIAALGIQP